MSHSTLGSLPVACVFLLLFAASFEGETAAQWTAKAEQLIRSGNSQEAIAALTRAAEAAGGSAESEDRIGFLFAVLGRQSDAAEHFQKSIALNVNFAPAHYHLGVARWLAKDTDGGLPELREAARLGPAVFDYRYRLGSAYLELGHYEEACSELKAAGFHRSVAGPRMERARAGAAAQTQIRMRQ